MNETCAQKQEALAPEAVEDKLLRLLDADPVRASQRYQQLFQQLVTLFAVRCCADPENLASETLTRVFFALSTGLEINVKVETFLFGVAKKILLEDYRRRRKAAIPLDELPVAHQPQVVPLQHSMEVPKWEQDLSLQCCRHCLQAFSQEQRTQLLLYYKGDREGESKRQRKQLADQLGITSRALSSRMLRLREKLDLCVNDCINRRQTK